MATDPYMKFCQEKYAEASKVAREMGDLLNSGESSAYEACCQAQDAASHWRKLIEATERFEDAA